MKRLLAALLLLTIMRTFGTDFTTEKLKDATARPFLTVVFHFEGGDIWLCERSLPSTYTVGVTTYTIERIIQSVGRIGTTLTRDFNIVDVGDTEIGFINLPVLETTAYAGSRFSDLFDSDFETVDVDLYLNYLKDDNSIVREIFASYIATAPSSFDEAIGKLTLTSRLEKSAQQNVLRIATKEDYPNIRDSDDGKPFALPFGNVRAIPALRLGDTIETGEQTYTICESPDENPVTSIDAIFWNGIEIAQGHIGITADLDSGIYPLEIIGAGYSKASSIQRGYRQKNLNDLTGSSTVQVGPTLDHAPYQPFTVPDNLINPRIVGILLDVRRSAADPAGPLRGEILDSLGGAGAVFDPDTEGGIDNEGNPIGTSSIPSDATTTGIAGFGPAVLHYSGTPVRPGQQLYLLLVQEGSGAFTSYYEVSKTSPPQPGFGTIIGDSGSIGMIVYYAIDGFTTLKTADITADETSGAVQALRSEFGISQGIVACGVKLRLGSIGAHADGEATVSLESLFDGTQLASLSIQASDLSPSSFTDVTRYFDAPVIMQSGEYALNIEGQLINSRGIVAQGSDKVTVTGLQPRTGSGTGPGHWAARMPFAVYKPVTKASDTSPSVPVEIVFEIITLDWDLYVTGYAHTGFAEVVFHPIDDTPDKTPQIPDSVQIAGEVTTTHHQPDEVIYALFARAGVEDPAIDISGSFAASGAKYAAIGSRFDGAVTVQQTYKTLWARLGFECRSIVDWQWDKAQLKWLPSPSDITASVLTFERCDIRHKGDDEHNPAMQIIVTRTPDSRLVNVIEAFYELNPADQNETGGYEKKRRFQSPASIAKFGERERPELFRFLYVADDATLFNTCSYWITRLAFKKRILDWEGFLTALGVEKDDPTDIDSSTVGGSGFGEGGFGEGGFGGGTSFSGLSPGKFFVIQSVEYDWNRDPRALILNAEEV